MTYVDTPLHNNYYTNDKYHNARLIIRNKSFQDCEFYSCKFDLCKNTSFTNCRIINTSFADCDVSWSTFAYCDIYNVDFTGAKLNDCIFQCLKRLVITYDETTRIPRACHTFVSHVLWEAAGVDVEKQMLAAFVGRKKDWCWSDFLEYDLTSDMKRATWALDVLRCYGLER